MATLEERVSRLEGRMQEQSGVLFELKDGIARLDAKMDSGYARLDTKMDVGFARLDAKMDAGFARLDSKMDAGFARLDDKMSRQFLWLIGMLVTLLGAVVGGLLSR